MFYYYYTTLFRMTTDLIMYVSSPCLQAFNTKQGKPNAHPMLKTLLCKNQFQLTLSISGDEMPQAISS